MNGSARTIPQGGRVSAPYTAADAWGEGKALSRREKTLVCQICRLEVHIAPYGSVNPRRPHPFADLHEDLNAHLGWHNRIEQPQPIQVNGHLADLTPEEVAKHIWEYVNRRDVMGR